MIKNLLGYPLIVAITFYLGILNKREWLLFACFAEIFVFFVQIIMLFYQKQNLNIETMLPETVLMEGEKAKAELSLKNYGILPVRRICFFVRYQYLSGKKKQKKEFTVWGNADREDTQSYEISAGPFPDGQFLFEIRYAEIYDYFGIFSLKIKLKKKRKITILPEFMEMEVPFLQREVPAENEIDTEKPGQEPGELYDIREYQAGDSLKQIYWKRSAARDELLYRENGALMGVKAVLFFPLPQNTEGMEFHYQIKLAGSFLYSLQECGYLHFFVWEHRESPVLTRKFIRTQEDILTALTELINGVSEENVTDRKKLRLWKEHRGKENYRREEISRIEEMKYRYEMQFTGEICPEAFFVFGKKEAFGKKGALLFHETEMIRKYPEGKS